MNRKIWINVGNLFILFDFWYTIDTYILHLKAQEIFKMVFMSRGPLGILKLEFFKKVRATEHSTLNFMVKYSIIFLYCFYIF